MSSGGHVASSSGCVTRPKEQEIGWTGYTVPTQYSLLIGRYVMATAEHREPCDSRGSCTVLGAPGGEIPPATSSIAPVERSRHVGFAPNSEHGAATQLTDASGHNPDSFDDSRLNAKPGRDELPAAVSLRQCRLERPTEVIR